MSANLLYKAIFESYPFGVIFSKKGPTDLNVINYETDFCYFYFSPGIERYSLLKRAQLCDGKTNAKKDFPDYQAYFIDDCKVMRDYTGGKILSFCEPWSPPGICTFIYTRKTAFFSNWQSYMLGCFDVVDDVVLGITTYKQQKCENDSTSSWQMTISDKWFTAAFDALPNGMEKQ